MSEPNIAKLVKVGRGGWSVKYGRWHTLSGYASTIDDTVADLVRHDHDYVPGCLIIDTTTIPDDAIVLLAVSGPGVDPDLEPGTVRKAGGGGVVAWDGGGDRFIGTRRPLAVMNGEGVAAVMLSTDPGAAIEALGANPSRSVFGNAGAFDDVAIDVYVAIAQRFGAQVVTVDEAFARADLRRTLDCLDHDEQPESRAALIDHALELTQQHPALAEEARAAGLPVTAPPAVDQLRRLDAVRSTPPPTLGL